VADGRTDQSICAIYANSRALSLRQKEVR